MRIRTRRLTREQVKTKQFPTSKDYNAALRLAAKVDAGLVAMMEARTK